MRPGHYSMTMQDITRYAAQTLHRYLDWADIGRKCTAERLLAVLFYAAARLCSIEAASRRLTDAPSGQALRSALRRLCPPSEQLEGTLNGALSARLPKRLQAKPVTLAMDLTLIPYHGQP